ncbi:unnamed protein product [Meloidogyne enterolobii]|uniref:Uncharacterized protein n=1 Tax=Meloidogyne enterolobii TaxID=390850 RepID=A0ACB1AU06_MELEN
MLIIRYWLKQLFKFAYFENASLEYGTLNPEMINLLFDNDKTIQKQFYVQYLKLEARNDINENIFEFTLNRFAIYESLRINFHEDDNIEKYTDILFNIIINEGNRLPRVNFNVILPFEVFDITKLYNLIFEYITTSKDLSKMVSSIYFSCYCRKLIFKLPESAETLKSTCYKIVNIYNPKIKFVLSNGGLPGHFSYVFIHRIEE